MFKNLFKEKTKTPKQVIEQLLQKILESGGFVLSLETTQKEGEIFINIFGEDETLLKDKDGHLLLAFQTYLNRVVRHYFYEQDIFVRLDSGNFFQEKEQQLLDLAETLKQEALSSQQPVYFKKALTPFQRRKVHQFLTESGEVKTFSEGEGFYKIICITPNNVKNSF